MPEAATTLTHHAFYDEPWLRRARTPLLIFVISAIVFTVFAGPRAKAPSPNNHFVYLADSYLHGTLEMREDPPHGNDWASYDTLTLASGDVYEGVWLDRRERRFRALDDAVYVFDRAELRGMQTDRTYYVSFPPMPAVLMMPFVAVMGFDLNDVLFTIAFAAANMALFYVLMRRLSLGGLSRLNDAENLWMTVLFGFGTNHLWCSVQGAVWFTALIIGVTFTLLYLLASIDAKHPFLAGLALGCAFATRTPLLFTVVVFAAFFFFPGGRLRRDFGARFWRDGLLFVAAPLVIGLALLYANYLRFDHLSEFGHSYLANGQIARIRDYGLFNVHFVSRNLAAMFALTPTLLPEAPWVQVSKHGLALWVTTPALLTLLVPRYADDAATKLWLRTCAAAVLICATLHVMYQNTGWVQFGFRFSLDYTVYLCVILALARERLGVGFKVLLVLGILVNAFGAVTFDRMHQHYADFLIEAAPL